MKKLTIAVLILFATSLFGAAFASGCMAMPDAPAMGAQERAPSCCAVKSACIGGSCFAPVHKAGCSADHGVVAVGQKSQSSIDLVKAPAPAIVPAPLFTALVHNAITRPPSRAHDSARIAGYADMYARTGRLLI